MWMNVQFWNWTIVLHMHTAWIQKDLTHVPVIMGIMTSILHSQEQIAWVRKDNHSINHMKPIYLSNIKIEFESSSHFLLLHFWGPFWMFLVTYLFFKGSHPILFCLWSPIILKGPKIQLIVFLFVSNAAPSVTMQPFMNNTTPSSITPPPPGTLGISSVYLQLCQKWSVMMHIFIRNHFESRLCCFPFFFKLIEQSLMEKKWVLCPLDHSGHPLLIPLHVQTILPSANQLLHAVCNAKMPSTHTGKGRFVNKF